MRSSKEKRKKDEKNCREKNNIRAVFFFSLSHPILLSTPPEKPSLHHFLALRAALAAGSDPNEVEAAGNTPLHSAAFEGWAEGVEALLRAGAKPLASNNAGDRPWHWATNMGHDAVAEMIASALPERDRALAAEQGKVIVQDHVPKVKEFFSKPCWSHHPKPYKDYIEARRRSDAAMRAAANADGAGLLPGL